MSETHHKQNLRIGPAIGTLLVPGPIGTIGAKVIVQEKQLRTRPCPFLGIHGFTTFLKVSFHDFLCIFFFIKILIYLWLRWVFIAAHRLSLVAVRGAPPLWGVPASHCSGSSCCGAQAPGHAGFCVYGAWVQQLQPEGSRVWAQTLWHMTLCQLSPWQVRRQTRVRTCDFCIGRQTPNHWTTTEVLISYVLFHVYSPINNSHVCNPNTNNSYHSNLII